jgi:hypothetical protein
LVALTAVKLDDLATAGCWLAQSAPHRNGAGWNVLEEATFQAVQAKTAANNCGGLVLGE